MSDRPFKVLGIQQIAVGGSDKHRLRRLWVDTLGLTLDGSFMSTRENVDEDIAFLGHGAHRVEVDLMQPVDPDRKPRVDSPPLNHVGLWVDDLAAAVDWLRESGVRIIGKIAPGAAHAQHMTTHSESKPHGCGVCGKRFKKRGQVTRHLKIHGEREGTRKYVRKDWYDAENGAAEDAVNCDIIGLE